MLQSKQDKQPTKAEMQDKVEAWKTINSVLVKANAEFMGKLNLMLVEKQKKQVELEAKLKDNKGSADDNAEYLFLGGYIQCLKDILGERRTQTK